MNRLRIFCSILMVVSTTVCFAQKTRLIEFGWDYPDVNDLSAGLPSMQNTPFDGICFSLQRQIMEAFDTAVKPLSYYEPTKLKKLRWGKYTSNFMILRGFGKEGGSWFDDDSWKVIIANMRNLSKAISPRAIKGILFDPEYYYENKLKNPWTYSNKQYPDKSFSELQRQVKKRGIQFINALQRNKPDLSFLSIWITSLIAEEKKYTALKDTRHALLVSFIEGIFEGKKNTVKLIDGNEYGYWNSKPSQFIETASYLKKNLVSLMQSVKAKEGALEIDIAQPIFYDGLLGRSPSFDKGFSSAAKWEWLGQNTKFALSTSDGIAWFYSERLNWWKGPVNDTLFKIIDSVKAAQTGLHVSSAKHTINRNTIASSIINRGKAHFYVDDKNNPMKTGEEAFSYQLDRYTKKLSFTFLETLPDSVSIFINNKLCKKFKPTALRDSINLDNQRKGKLILLAKYPDKTEAVSEAMAM